MANSGTCSPRKEARSAATSSEARLIEPAEFPIPLMNAAPASVVTFATRVLVGKVSITRRSSAGCQMDPQCSTTVTPLGSSLLPKKTLIGHLSGTKTVFDYLFLSQAIEFAWRALRESNPCYRRERAFLLSTAVRDIIGVGRASKPRRETFSEAGRNTSAPGELS